jgi:hypothetical protein
LAAALACASAERRTFVERAPGRAGGGRCSGMRKTLIGGFMLIIEVLLIVGYLTLSFAARTALAVAPSE